MAMGHDDEDRRDKTQEMMPVGSSGDQETKRQQAERLLAEKLIGGDEAASADTDAKLEAVRRLPPRWEIRIQTEHDPVAEETKKYRSMAQEVDDRYDDKKE